MSLFATLLIGHLIADFPLQIRPVLDAKNRGGLGILPHALIHLAVMALLIEDPLRHWAILAAIVVPHYFIDWTKVSVDKNASGLGFILDQAAHVLILWLVTNYFVSAAPHFAFANLPILLGLTLTSAGFMFVVIVKDRITRLPLPCFATQNALFLSKGAGWLAVVSMIALANV